MGRARSQTRAAAGTVKQFNTALGSRRGSGDDGYAQKAEQALLIGEIDEAVDLLARMKPAARARHKQLETALVKVLATESWNEIDELAGAFAMKIQILCQQTGVGPNEHQAYGQQIIVALTERIKRETAALIEGGELRPRIYREHAAAGGGRAVVSVFAATAKAGGEYALVEALGSGLYDELCGLLHVSTLNQLCPLSAWEEGLRERWDDARAGSAAIATGKLLLSPWLAPAIRENGGWQEDTRRVVIMPSPPRESRAAHYTLEDGAEGDAKLAELLAAGGHLQS
jgi:hypothetical protein